MIGLLQRVERAHVECEGVTVGAIGAGLLALIGVERGDDAPQGERLLERILTYRVFADANGRMNLSLDDIGGELLLVPQFTLAADTRKGTRASFALAAPPEQGLVLFNELVDYAHSRYPKIACGRFGTHMRIHLVNEGPVTFWLRVEPGRVS